MRDHYLGHFPLQDHIGFDIGKLSVPALVVSALRALLELGDKFPDVQFRQNIDQFFLDLHMLDYWMFGFAKILELSLR